MEPTNDTKMQIKLMAMVIVSSVGIAFAGQWVFNKCFKQKDEKVVPQKVENVPDSLRRDTVYNMVQKQK